MSFLEKPESSSHDSPPFNLSTPKSILRSPWTPTASPFSRQRSSSSSSGSGSGRSNSTFGSSPSKSPSRVSFGEVEVLEFTQCAGSPSQGVPDEGNFSLYLGDLENHPSNISVGEFEASRQTKWERRAKILHWPAPPTDLYTCGREDEFYHSLSPKQRIQKIQKLLGKKEMVKVKRNSDVRKEVKQLDNIRQSRKHVCCTCRPLSQMSTTELRDVLKRYDLPSHGKRKFLLERLSSKLRSSPKFTAKCGRKSSQQQSLNTARRNTELNATPQYGPTMTTAYKYPKKNGKNGKKKGNSKKQKNKKQNQKKSHKMKSILEVCCWDPTQCQCAANGIECHEGVSDSSELGGICGCLKFDATCKNPDGRYVYTPPTFDKSVILEWEHTYINDDDDDVDIQFDIEPLSI